MPEPTAGKTFGASHGRQRLGNDHDLGTHPLHIQREAVRDDFDPHQGLALCIDRGDGWHRAIPLVDGERAAYAWPQTSQHHAKYQSFTRLAT